MADIKFNIVQHVGVIREGSKGYKRELNLVSWNDAEPKYDIRDWAPDHEKMGKGITLTKDELKALAKLIENI